MGVKHFCKVCGKPLEDGETVCTRCCTQIESGRPQSDSSELIYQAAEIVADAGQSPVEPESIRAEGEIPREETGDEGSDGAEGAQNAEPDDVTESDQKRTGKKRRRAPAVIITILIILLLGFGALNFQYIKCLVLGSENYYLLTEKNQSSEYGQAFSQFFTSLFNETSSAKGKLDLKVASNTLNTSDKALLNSLSLYFNRSNSDGTTALDLSLKSQKTPVLTAEVYSGDAVTAAAFPEVTGERQLAFVGTDLISGSETKDFENNYLFGFSKKEYLNLIENYAKEILLPSLRHCEVKKGVKFYKNNYCTALTFSFTKQARITLATELQQTISSDDAISKLAENYLYTATGRMPDETEIERLLTEVSKKLVGAVESVSGKDPEYTVFVSSAGRVLFRGFQGGGIEISAGSYHEDGNKALEIFWKNEASDVDFRLLNSLVVQNGVINGSCTAKNNGEEIFGADYRLDGTKKLSGAAVPSVKISARINEKDGDKYLLLSGDISGETYIARLKYEQKGQKGYTVELNSTAAVSVNAEPKPVSVKQTNEFDYDKDGKKLKKSVVSKLTRLGFHEIMAEYFPGLLKFK